MSRWAIVAVSASLMAGCVKAPEVLPPEAVPGATGVADQLWPGKPPGELYAVGAVRAWVLEQAGQQIGASYGRYAGPHPSRADQHVFETRIELDIPGRPPVRSEGRVVLDAGGNLVEGFERSDAAEITFERRGSFVRLEAGRASDEVTYQPERVDTAFWADTAILHEELMLGLRPLSAGEQGWRLVSLSGGVPVEWAGDVTASADGTIWIKTNLGEEIRFRDGRIVSVSVKADELEVKEDPKPAWPTWEIRGPRELTYAPPEGATFTRREVELPGAEDRARLTGEVLIPGGKGPFPVAVMLAGAGQQDRYGFAGPPAVDLGSHHVGDALAGAGFMVLRYDEPGFGGSAPAELSFARQVDDAKRAYATAIVQPEADPDRVILVGHGEGGWRALMLAGAHGEVKGVVLLATPGRPYREVMMHQAEATLADLPPEMRDQARQTSALMLDEIENGTEVPPELRGQATWLRQILKVKVSELFRGVKARVLIAQGDKDFEVDPERDSNALKRAAKSTRVHAEVRRYPDLDHLFMVEPDRSSPARYLEPDRPMGETFLRELGEWARRTVGLR